MDLTPTAGTSRAIYDPSAAAIVRGVPRERAEKAVEEIVVKGERPGDSKMSFWDFIDVINPLQHIPVVNTIYRELTGDTISTPAKLVGSTLLGGPVGFAAAMVDSIVEEETGKDMGGHVVAMLRGGEDPGADPTRIARERANTQPTQIAAANPREFVPQSPSVTSAAETFGTPPPNDAESMITAAQIAAKAQVAMPVRAYGAIRNTDLGATAAPPTSAAPSAADPAMLARARAGKFMPLNPEATQGRDLRSPLRRNDAPTTTVQELRARARFAPGSLAVGGDIGTRSAATVEAVVMKSDAAAMEDKSPASLPDARAQFDYAVQAAQGAGPVTVPGWFDQAMLSAIDKYNATAGRSPVAAPASRKLY